MGFDDMRPRARVYDSWGLIGSRHGQAEPKPEPRPAKAEDDLEEGDPCPGCDTALTWVTTNACHPSQYAQLGCAACGELFGETFP